ncbi:hypothetical protein G7K_0669-t1 [Saitoella complicata NRRL Y-17804]|uniref:U3 small nucleolar RNA-associated protein 6 N-terminal domain-containing protein n=2 Tax=Saitoella complicata (strain BCRC 22490 / CBS 7301 / JCM 7358 / NBRC 10748 / NRRL Y-17804) TaxID=698492 RepID=A0A0E9N9H3_SAICN|nr:hypothetical protein G7K_0669-t1 [Saitoella complicata NRRL Y-17804]
MTDKVQYYIEQGLPELKDLEQKKIFSKLECKAIMKKRTEFEQALARRIAKKTDFLRYVEYEMNLEALRKKRVKRLNIMGKPTVSDWAGQRRIFFILDRATRKFHGDIALWVQYINYARSQKSNKVINRAFASALQMHPTCPQLWILAAQHQFEENGDVTAGRTFMQRGLRLNKDSEDMWVEYAKLEMVYIAKLYARRRILGIDEQEEETKQEESEDDEDGNIKLPTIIAAEMDDGTPKDKNLLSEVEVKALTNAANNPALSGAIPLSITKSAFSALPKSTSLPTRLWELFESFKQLPEVRQQLCQMVEDYLRTQFPNTPKALFFLLVLPTKTLEHGAVDPAFPAALREVLKGFSATLVAARPRAELYDLFLAYLHEYLSLPVLETNLEKLLSAFFAKTVKDAEKEGELGAKGYAVWVRRLLAKERNAEAGQVLERAVRKWGESRDLEEARELL